MRKTLMLTAVTAALVVLATGAARGAGLNACSLVTAKQAASLGVTKSCTGKTLPAVGGAVAAEASWGAPGKTPAALSLTVTTFSSTSGPAWQVSMQTLKILPGRSMKVSGIGSVAYESGGGGGTLSSIHFVKGKRVVSFSWYSKKAQTSLKTFNAVAKAIAAQV